MEWKCFVDAFVPDLVQEVKEHLDTLPAPGMNEVVTIQYLPFGYMKRIASLIDDHLPHWNLVERAIICQVCAKEIYDTAAGMWRDMVRQKNNITPEQAEASIQQLTRDN